MRAGFLASGNGTNAENLIKEIQAGRLPLEAKVVITDKPQAGVIERAKQLAVETVVLDRKQFDSRQAFEKAVEDVLEEKKIDLIVLAGFMRILSEGFVNRFLGRIINIHPAFLPAFPGAHAIRDAWNAKVTQTGVTVHFVTPEVDVGPVILQEKVDIGPEDTLESLEARIHALEYKIYPKALRLVAEGKAKMM